MINPLKQMKYYWQQHNRFNLEAKDAGLYFYLFEICNDDRWPDKFEVSNRQITEDLNMDFRYIQGSRERLQKAGLIQFVTSNGSKYVTYSLIECLQTSAPNAKVTSKTFDANVKVGEKKGKTSASNVKVDEKNAKTFDTNVEVLESENKTSATTFAPNVKVENPHYIILKTENIREEEEKNSSPPQNENSNQDSKENSTEVGKEKNVPPKKESEVEGIVIVEPEEIARRLKFQDYDVVPGLVRNYQITLEQTHVLIDRFVLLKKSELRRNYPEVPPYFLNWVNRNILDFKRELKTNRNESGTGNIARKGHNIEAAMDLADDILNTNHGQNPGH